MESIGSRLVEIAEKTVASVTTDEVHNRLKAGEPIVVLDVREPDEWAAGHIEGAMSLSRGRLELRLEELMPDKDAFIVAH